MSNNKEKEYRRRLKRIRHILGNKFISAHDLNVVGYELNMLRKICDMNYTLAVVYGKYYLQRGNNEKAIKYFVDAINCCGDVIPKAAYYGLFKANINLKNYEEALRTLKKYDSCYDVNFNMDLYFDSLNKLLYLSGHKQNVDKNNYKNCTPGFINCVKCPINCISLYNEAKEAFKDGHYDISLKKLKVFQKICEDENYFIDITHLIKIMTELVKVNDKKLEEVRIEKMASIRNDEEKRKYLINEVNNNYKDVYSLVQLVYLLIRKKQFDEAYLWLNHEMDKDGKEKYIKELNNARKIVYEKINYKKNIDSISDYVNKIDELVANREIKDAIKIGYEAYQKLNIPFFLYKIGEIYFSQYNFADAKKLFLRYLCEGDMLKDNCYVYLYFCTKKKDKKKAKKYLDNIKDDNYFECYMKAETIFLEREKKNQQMIFDDMGKDFNNYLKGIISSIKKGQIFRIETINRNKFMGDVFALIEIYAAPYLLDQGAIDLAEKYYENAKNFTDDERINDLIKTYEKKRKDIN